MGSSSVESPWSQDVVSRAAEALEREADPSRAVTMADYMRNVAPFLGVQAGPRRKALRAAWKDLPTPTSDELGEAARALVAQESRELHYAAYDLIDRYLGSADDRFLSAHVETLLTTTPWWDTVDGLTSAAVSPLSLRDDTRAVIDRWSASGDRWLIRAAIQHQRGHGASTDVARVLELCDQHWDESEFFIAKAIGWALRDLARLDPDAVEGFIAAHSETNRVALREARRGLAANR